MLGWLRQRKRRKLLNKLLENGRERIYKRENKPIPPKWMEVNIKDSEGKFHTYETMNVAKEQVKERNPDFDVLWQLKTKKGQFRFSRSKSTGEILISFGGGPHWVAVPLEDHDKRDLIAALLSNYITRNEPKKAAYMQHRRPYIPLNILREMREFHDRVSHPRPRRDSGDNRDSTAPKPDSREGD